MNNKKNKIDIDDISDEAANKKRDEFNRREQENLDEDLRYLLKQRQFRTFFWNLLGKCQMFQSSFTGNSTTFFNEGKREIGLQELEGVLAVNPKAYLAMIEESQQRETLKKEKLNG